MEPVYYVVSSEGNAAITAQIRPAEQQDFLKTEEDNWQTSWMSDFIQDVSLEKYALEVAATSELIGLGVYRNMPEGVLVYVEYIESAPESNPTVTNTRKYKGIGAALLAYGAQLSIDYGYGGAIPFSRYDPFLLLIDGDAAWELFSQYLEKEE